METDTDIEYVFSELSDAAKQYARDAYTSNGYPYAVWWDGVYEDANQVAKILGLDIESTRINEKRKIYTVVDISFSGFSSQGDGACFRGSYRPNLCAVEEINAYCNDKELIRIATELTVMQTTQRLLGCEPFRASITTSGNYSHSHSIKIDIHDWGIDEVGEPDEAQFAQLMRDFADYIYKSLESEHDYLMSDEVVDARLSEEKFDEDGIQL